MENDKSQRLKFSIWPHDRVSGFTDGIFAFAITLLVLNLINLTIPAGNQSLIPLFRANAATLISFVVTFIIISRFWMSHTSLFANIQEYDRTIISLNNTLLFFITVFPFVASLLGTHIGNKDAVIMYAACFAMVGILQYLIGRHAYMHKLLIQDDLIDDNFLKIFTIYSLSTPIIFLISIIVAFFSPFFAEVIWLALLFLRIGFRYYYRNNRQAEKEIEKL